MEPAWQGVQAVAAIVPGAIQDHDIEAFFDQGDEGQEGIAAGAAFEQIIGRGVAGGDDDDAAVEQGFEQPAEQDRIGDVIDLEFIETQQRGLSRDLIGERRDRVFAAGIGAFPGEDPLVSLLHELVEMDAAFAFDQCFGEEQIHQHGFAAADFAHQIKAAGMIFGSFIEAFQPQQAAEEAIILALLGGIVVFEFLPKVLETFGGERLGGIGLECAAGQQRAVRKQRALLAG